MRVNTRVPPIYYCTLQRPASPPSCPTSSISSWEPRITCLQATTVTTLPPPSSSSFSSSGLIPHPHTLHASILRLCASRHSNSTTFSPRQQSRHHHLCHRRLERRRLHFQYPRFLLLPFVTRTCNARWSFNAFFSSLFIKLRISLTQQENLLPITSPTTCYILDICNWHFILSNFRLLRISGPSRADADRFVTDPSPQQSRTTLALNCRGYRGIGNTTGLSFPFLSFFFHHSYRCAWRGAY